MFPHITFHWVDKDDQNLCYCDTNSLIEYEEKYGPPQYVLMSTKLGQLPYHFKYIPRSTNVS